MKRTFDQAWMKKKRAGFLLFCSVPHASDEKETTGSVPASGFETKDRPQLFIFQRPVLDILPAAPGGPLAQNTVDRDIQDQDRNRSKTVKIDHLSALCEYRPGCWIGSRRFGSMMHKIGQKGPVHFVKCGGKRQEIVMAYSVDHVHRAVFGENVVEMPVSIH